MRLRRAAERFLRRAPKDVAEAIMERLRELAGNPSCERRLRPPLKGLCRARVGSYRIAYRLEPCNVIVVAIGERESFYERLRG